jgi:hypothetical protein
VSEVSILLTCLRSAFHEERELLSVLRFPFRVRTPFRNKIPETLKLGCLCNGMKTLISDHDYELHLGGTAGLLLALFLIPVDLFAWTNGELF